MSFKKVDRRGALGEDHAQEESIHTKATTGPITDRDRVLPDDTPQKQHTEKAAVTTTK